MLNFYEVTVFCSHAKSNTGGRTILKNNFPRAWWEIKKHIQDHNPIFKAASDCNGCCQVRVIVKNLSGEREEDYEKKLKQWLMLMGYCDKFAN